MALFSKLNPNLENDGPETLLTMAAYMPLSKKPKYEQTAAGKIISYIPVVALAKAIFSKKTYTSGQRALGERFLDHIQGLNVGQADVPDDAYVAATIFFTIAFGVRITTSEDLDALNDSADAYYKRPDKGDIPRAAVDRAVYLKKTFFPNSSYNKGQWDLTKFQDYPLVAPIPGIEYKTLMNGEVAGLGPIENGIPMNPPTISPPTGNTDPKTGASASQPTTTSGLQNEQAVAAQDIPSDKDNTVMLVAVIGGGLLLIGVLAILAFKK